MGAISVQRQYGKVQIHLEEPRKARGMSKNKLCHLAEMQRAQINQYSKNQVSRLDIDVLARLCAALDCDIGDLLTYEPPGPGHT